MLLWGDNGRSQEIGDRTQDAGVRRSERKDRMQRAPFASPGALSSEGQQNAPHAEDGRFQPAADKILDCRLSFFDLQSPSSWRYTNMLIKVRKMGANSNRINGLKVVPISY